MTVEKFQVPVMGTAARKQRSGERKLLKYGTPTPPEELAVGDRVSVRLETSDGTKTSAGVITKVSPSKHPQHTTIVRVLTSGRREMVVRLPNERIIVRKS